MPGTRPFAVPSALAAAIALFAAGASGQSLAEIARREQVRRAAIPEERKSRVYTNDDLRESGGLTIGATRRSDPPPSGTAQGAGEPATGNDTGGTDRADGTGPEADEVRDETYWRGRMTTAQEARTRAALMASALQNRADGLWAQFTATDDPAQRRAIEGQRNEALAELENTRMELEELDREIAGIREEARRAGAPPGWLR